MKIDSIQTDTVEVRAGEGNPSKNFRRARMIVKVSRTEQFF